MASVERVGDLEVTQDLDFNRREWTVQRVGWAAMAVVILLALLGITGSGVLADASVGDPTDPLRIAYSRFDRLEAPTSLVVDLSGEAVAGQEVTFWVDRGYLKEIELQAITPQPREVLAGPDRLTYVFAVDEPGRPLEVVFEMRHMGFGWKSGRVGLPDWPGLGFGQLVYP